MSGNSRRVETGRKGGKYAGIDCLQHRSGSDTNCLEGDFSDGQAPPLRSLGANRSQVVETAGQPGQRRKPNPFSHKRRPLTGTIVGRRWPSERLALATCPDWYRGSACAAARQNGRADKQLTSRLRREAVFKGCREASANAFLPEKTVDLRPQRTRDCGTDVRRCGCTVKSPSGRSARDGLKSRAIERVRHLKAAR